MRFLVILLLLTITAALAEVERVRYDGYKTYRVIPGDLNKAHTLKTFERIYELDFLNEIRSLGKPVDITVKPKYQREFETNLNNSGIKYEITIQDVQRQMEIGRLMENIKTRKSKSSRIDLNRYNTHDEINAYLEQLAKDYSDIVSIENIGQSYEKRDMKVIKISTGGNGNKPAILVDGGIHAREWAAPAENLCLINSLVEDPNNRYLIENVDWYILPVVNPDGYTYSRTKDQMWRKTRSKGVHCYGADPNRNFDFHWMESGADSYECSIIYGGKEAFSEIESVNLANFALKYRKQIKLYLTFHSCGQYILVPWGYDAIYPDNFDVMLNLAEEAGLAIFSVYDTDYIVGNTAETLYPAAGGSDDWVKGVAGVPISYTIELPCGGSQGFDLPPSRLRSVCTETFEGIKVFHKYVENNSL